MTAVHSFGALVRRQRKALDLTQAALARRVGCAESLIRKIEAEERRPSRQVAERLADALEIVSEERGLFVEVARGERAATQLVLHDQRLSRQSVQPDPPLPLSVLPAPLTPLVGREAELRALDALLADPACRLLTIVAPGGMGKTRLAVAAAARQQGTARFPHGVALLDLTPIEHAERISTSLAALFGLPPDSAGRAGQTAEARILSYLRTKRLLLVLDNAEHLLDAAPLFTAILHTAPGAALLITSRERLRLHGEHLFPLGGLSVPADPLLAEHSDATRLFLQVARRANPTWAPIAADLRAIAAICRLTGGMPLAIELAGAWAAVLAPPAILAELRRDLGILSTALGDVPERQRSVRAIFDASWRQMGPRLQAVFVRLAVFRAGFTFQAATSVAGASLHDLADLVAAAVLSYNSERQRYTLHELLRQYAAERLAQDPIAEAATLDAHAAFFCAYVAQHAPNLRSSEQRAAQVALERDHQDISAAWRRVVRQRRHDLIDATAHALGLFYEQRADTVQGAAAFDDEVAAIAEEPLMSRELRARLLTWRSAFLRPLGRLPEAEQLAGRALELLGQAREASDTWRAAKAHAHIRLALVVDNLRGAEAQAEYELALRYYRALGRVWEEGYVLYHIAGLSCDLDRLEAAARYGRASLALRESCGDPRGVAHSLQLLSRVCLARGQLDEALALAHRCCASFEQLGDRAGVAKGLRQLGTVLFWHGRFTEALPLAEQSQAIYHDLGLSVDLGTAQALISLLCAALGQVKRSEEAARAAIALHQQHPSALTEDYVALGMALLAAGHDGEAEQALRASVALHKQLGRGAVPRAAPLLALCLVSRDARADARQMLAAALYTAGEQRAFIPAIIGLAVAASLLADAGDTERAIQCAALVEHFPVVANNRGLLARLQPRRAAGLALFGPLGSQAAVEPESSQSIWELARELGIALGAAG